MAIKRNSIICGDNLDWLADIQSESVDLCYLDPPLPGKPKDRVIWGDRSEAMALEAMAATSFESYRSGLLSRLQLVRKSLKESGAILFHTSPEISHQVRFLLEEVFGSENYRNCIVWNHNRPGVKPRDRFPGASDHLLLFSKSSKFRIFSDAGQSKMAKKPNRGNNAKAGLLNDVWTGIPAADGPMLKGTYPTRKPTELLRQIIENTSPVGGLVLDCFAGGGTAAIAAAQADRHFIIGDASSVAVQVAQYRLEVECKNKTPIQNLSEDQIAATKDLVKRYSSPKRT